MIYDSRHIANLLIELARTRGELLTPMQLIKLVYIAHGWMLGLYHRPLVKDEVQAWQYGPVIPSLYNALRKYRSQAVTELIPASRTRIDESAQNILDQVYDRYGRMSGPALSRLTHAAGTPWDHTYVPGSFGIVIPTDMIEDYYAQLGANSG